jgi:hypothetical protein
MSKSFVIARPKVQNFSTWKTIYDTGASERETQGGLKQIHLLSNLENKNEVTIIFETSNVEKAKKFLFSEEAQERMKQSGVIGKPEISFLS